MTVIRGWLQSEISPKPFVTEGECIFAFDDIIIKLSF